MNWLKFINHFCDTFVAKILKNICLKKFKNISNLGVPLETKKIFAMAYFKSLKIKK